MRLTDFPLGWTSSTGCHRSARKPPMGGRPGSTNAFATANTRATTARTRPISSIGSGPTETLRVLVLNAGSSSLKVSLVDEDDRSLAENDFEVAEGRLDETQLAAAGRGVGTAGVVRPRLANRGYR